MCGHNFASKFKIMTTLNSVRALIAALKQETEAGAITPNALGIILEEIVNLIRDYVSTYAGCNCNQPSTIEPTTPTPYPPVVGGEEAEEDTTTLEPTTTEEPTTTPEPTTPEPVTEGEYTVLRFDKAIYSVRIDGNTDVIAPFYFVENDTLYMNVAANMHDLTSSLRSSTERQ